MKTFMILLGLVLTTNAGFAADAVSRYVECNLVETPTGGNDSWGIYIDAEHIGFFDNDHMTYGKRTNIYEDEGGSTLYVFTSSDSEDPWQVIMDEPDFKYLKHTYLELYLDGNLDGRPYIFECIKATQEDIEPMFEE